MEYEKLSAEQRQFIDYALNGHNILVDACIGSGKTTAIQMLCDLMPGKRILYLTYNKLLKLDAKDRIKNHYVNVTNYHGFCYSELLRIGIKPGIAEMIQVYNQKKPACSKYDALILDEYQDIEQEIADMLVHVKNCCKGIQLIAVGDMSQKIYDKTRLDAQTFITGFLDNYIPMEFTNCFRIGAKHAAMLGRIWNKSITGVNDAFEIKWMHEAEIQKTVSDLQPRELLVLGSKAGEAQKLQNYLEERHPDVFNKRTLWSKIKEGDGATNPTPDCAIFTTYDGCKGMERDVCVLYDWSAHYWETRMNKPDARYEILRNVFCVAASRAKKLLIIAKTDCPLEEEDLANAGSCRMPYRDMGISDMFDYKYIEDVEAAYACLEVTETQPAGDAINVPVNDELIDLSPCIGHYQEAMYFQNYDIDSELEYRLEQADRSYMRRPYKRFNLDQKLLYLSTLETKQQRYMNQVKSLPISEENRERIRSRLEAHFPADAVVQQNCQLPFYKGNKLLFHATGIVDVVLDDIVYELKFVSALSHTHALQTAMYLACTGYATGRLFNVRTNQMYEIKIPDRELFLNKVTKAVTKGEISNYSMPDGEACARFYEQHETACEAFLSIARKRERQSPKGVEKYFFKHGLQLPVSGSVFLKDLRTRGFL